MKTKMPLVSECANCQAVADSRVLFLTIESIARQQDMSPDRMARALRDLAAMWQSMSTQMLLPEGQGVPSAEVDRLATEAADSVRYAFSDVPQGHTH